ncbi:unnamed protein product [Closterium sp. NIES-54]
MTRILSCGPIASPCAAWHADFIRTLSKGAEDSLPAQRLCCHAGSSAGSCGYFPPAPNKDPVSEVHCPARPMRPAVLLPCSSVCPTALLLPLQPLLLPCVPRVPCSPAAHCAPCCAVRALLPSARAMHSPPPPPPPPPLLLPLPAAHAAVWVGGGGRGGEGVRGRLHLQRQPASSLSQQHLLLWGGV